MMHANQTEETRLKSITSIFMWEVLTGLIKANSDEKLILMNMLLVLASKELSK